MDNSLARLQFLVSVLLPDHFPILRKIQWPHIFYIFHYAQTIILHFIPRCPSVY